MSTLINALEAMLLIAPSPQTAEELAAALEAEPEVTEDALAQLRSQLEGRGVRLAQNEGAWRLYAAPEHLEVCRRLIAGTKPAKLSQAALETLAIIAYKQPVSRAQIAQIRGVNVDSVVRNLQLRGLIEETPSETAATLYRTTTQFLETFGLDTIGELPPLGPNFPANETLDEILQEVKDR